MEYRKFMNESLSQGPNLGTNESEILSGATPFKQLIDVLLRLADSLRPDIALTVDYLFRYIHKPTQIL